MPVINDTANRLTEQLPVYVTAKVAAQLAGVYTRTFTKYASPDSLRMDCDGSLHPLYTIASVETFKATYRDGRFKAASR